MNLTYLDYCALASYLMLILYIGYRCSRSNDSTDAYFFADRKVPGWLIGLSLVGTSISSITFIAYPADAFKTNWLRYLPNLALPIAIVFAIGWFLPYFRKKNVLTAYELLEQKFGPSIRVYTSTAFIITQWLRLSMILYLLSLLIEYLLSTNPVIAILISGLIVGAYTYFGGIRAVIWTDALQSIMLLFGGVVCWYFIWQAIPGGLTQILEIATDAQKFSFTESANALDQNSWSFSLTEKTALMMLFVGLSAWLTEYSANQNTVQRYIAAKSEGHARTGLLVYLVSSLPIWAFYMFLGTSLYAFFNLFPTFESEAMLSGETSSEYILPYFMSNYLPAGIAGLLIAAGLSAAMSSLDSSLNAISTVGIFDVYKRFLVKNRTDRHYLRIGHLITAVSTFIMMAGAYAFYQMQHLTLQHIATIITAVLGSGLLGIFMLAIFVKRPIAAKSVWIGLSATWIFTIWGVLTQHELAKGLFALPVDLYYVGILGNIIMLIVVFIHTHFVDKAEIAQKMQASPAQQLVLPEDEFDPILDEPKQITQPSKIPN